ncbi:MAG TPA: hypothetical protein VMI56_06115 [Reyranella sp.]|nr:hypothetical protein [Reyranella sp.]
MFIKHWSLPATAALLLALAACVPQKPASNLPNYQAPVTQLAPPANLAAICFDSMDMGVMHERMVQQEVVVGVLQCKNDDGTRKLDAAYGQFIQKFGPELTANAENLKSLAARKHGNVDRWVTEIANRTATVRNEDAKACLRQQSALEWSLSPSVTTLTQVPPPYDFGPEMNVFPCPK